MHSKSISELFMDKNLNDIIRKMSSFRNEYDDAKSELFYILCSGGVVEKIPSYQQQIYYCSDILKKTLHSSSSPYYKEFINGGFPKSVKIKDISIDSDQLKYEEGVSKLFDISSDRYVIIIDKINSILNTEIPWYQSHLFRLHYLPFPDPHCEKSVYSLRGIERMHTYGEYKIDHVAIFHKVKKTLSYIIKRLKEEGLIKRSDMCDDKMKRIFDSN